MSTVVKFAKGVRKSIRHLSATAAFAGNQEEESASAPSSAAPVKSSSNIALEQEDLVKVPVHPQLPRPPMMGSKVEETTHEYLKAERGALQEERDDSGKKSWILTTLQVACVGGSIVCLFKEGDGSGAARFMSTAVAIELVSHLQRDVVGLSSSLAATGLAHIGDRVESASRVFAEGHATGLENFGAGIGAGMPEWHPVTLSALNFGGKKQNADSDR